MSEHQTTAKDSPFTAAGRLKRNAIVTNLALDPEAKQLLIEMAPPKSYGAFVSGLLRAEKARVEERQRLRRQRAAVPEH